MASGSSNNLPVEIFQLLESSDISQNIREVILENLSSSKETWLIPLLVDYYFRTQSSNVKEIISELRETHAKVLIEKLQDGVKTQETRLPALQLILYLVYKELPWCHQLLEMPFFSSIIKCLKTEHDVPILMTSLMIVVILLPSAPVSMGRILPQLFEVFGRLTLFCVRKPANTPDLFLLHLQVGLYSLFHRLYGMFPCSFLDYINKFFSLKENFMAYEEVVMPMLERVRLHPNIIMSKGQNEMDTNRWKNQETQDIIVNCSKLSLDLIEGSLEESQCPVYQSVQDVIARSSIFKTAEDGTKLESKPIPVPEPVTDGHADSRFLMPWTDETVVVGESPSVLIGLSTPPSSQRTTPAASFLEPNNGGLCGATPDSASRQATPCYGGMEDGDRTPLSSNRSSVSHNLSKLSDSGRKQQQQQPAIVTPKAVPSTTAPHTTPVNVGNSLHSGPSFSSPINVTPLGLAETSPLKSQPSAFISPKKSRSPAMRTIQFPNNESREDCPVTKQDKNEIQVNLEKQLKPVHEGKKETDVHKLEDGLENPEDQEVEEINEREDQFNIEGSPTSSISTQTSQTEVTAESVRQFMKKVNRIRFNSLTSNSSSEHDPHIKDAVGIERLRRPRSCPPLKRVAHRWCVESKGLGSKEDGLPGVGKHHHQGARRRSRKSWMKEDRAVEEEEDGEKTEEVSEESGEDLSSGNNSTNGGTVVPIPKITVVKSKHLKATKPPSTQNASTQVVRAFPAEINPAFQMLFAPSKIAVCNKCQQDIVLTSSHHSDPTKPLADRKVTTIKGTEVSVFNSLSPPELLDRHLKLGSELHAKELNKIPLTSKDSVNWTHFGGVPPADEVNILKGQILLMQAQLMYERHKRSNHAKRNRRLLRRIAHEAKLEEQQKTLSDQIRLLEQEVQQLSVSNKLYQEDNRRLRLGQESDEYSKLVQYRSSIQENKDLRAASVELKNLLLTQKEDYDKLHKKLEHVEHVNLEQEKDLKNCKERLANTEKLKGQVFKLQKELLLMQELHLKYQEKLHHNFPSHHQKNEQDLLVSSLRLQLEGLEKENRKKSTLLEAYQASAIDNENVMKQKDFDIIKLKHDVSKRKSEHAEQIKALEARTTSLIHTNQELETRIVDLLGKVDQDCHKAMIEALKKNEARDKPLQGCAQKHILENPAKLVDSGDNIKKLADNNNSPHSAYTDDKDINISTRNTAIDSGDGGAVNVVMAKEEVSAEGSTFFQNDGNGNFCGRNPSLSMRSRAETEIYSDSGAASRSSFRVDSDVSMRSVSQDSLITGDSGCWPKT